jgi:hypothetical protein
MVGGGRWRIGWMKRRLRSGGLRIQYRQSICQAHDHPFDFFMTGDYKKGKKLSEALAIMFRMKAEGHIDPETFDLFMDTGIYLQYAKKYMPPELIDTETGEN